MANLTYLSVFGHVATVLPTPSKVYCKKLKKVMIDVEVKGNLLKLKTLLN